MKVGEIFFVSNERWSHEIGDRFSVRWRNTNNVIVEAIDEDKSGVFYKILKIENLQNSKI